MFSILWDKIIMEISEFKNFGCKCSSQNPSNSLGPRIFKFNFGSEGLRFSNNVNVYTIFMNGKPVLYMLDEAANFSGAWFLNNSKSTEEILNTIQDLWILTYMGPNV